MSIPRDADARRYYRVAYQRLDDGRLMLERLDRPAAAIYLTGYAVECILKALILSTTPAARRAEVLRSFRGAVAHEMLWLRDQLTKRRVSIPVMVARELVYVAGWSVDLRYEPGPGNREDARRFVASARSIVTWADDRM